MYIEPDHTALTKRAIFHIPISKPSTHADLLDVTDVNKPLRNHSVHVDDEMNELCVEIPHLPHLDISARAH